MSIMGIDIDSRKFGLAIVDEHNTIKCKVFYQIDSKNTEDRLFALYDELNRLLDFSGNDYEEDNNNTNDSLYPEDKPNKIYIEEAIYVSNFKTSRAISEVIGNLKILCRNKGFEFEMVPNKTWKKEIIGNGNASKDDIRKWVVDHYKKVGNDGPQDLYDAICIALYGVKRNE